MTSAPVMLTAIIGCAAAPVVAGRAEQSGGPVRYIKRGPRAWENWHSDPLLPLRSGGTTRLLVHAVADSSSALWIPKVRAFFDYCVEQGENLESAASIDMAAAQYMDLLCYGNLAHPSQGALLLFGLLCLAPELKGKLHLAARSMKSWTKLVTTVEGGPVPEDIIMLIAVNLMASGCTEEAVWVLVQYDVYGREQDMQQLHVEHVSCDGHRVALLFGDSARGLSSKTGVNQGTIIRRGIMADLLLAMQEFRIKHKQPMIFTISQQTLRANWHQVCRAIGVPFAGPPHSIRHSGPSEDLARNIASLETVRRRGRWKALESVQRYTKTFALVRFWARTPSVTRERATRAARDLRKALVLAIDAGTHPDPLQLALRRILTHPRCADQEADAVYTSKSRPASARSRSSRSPTRSASSSDELDFSDAHWASD